VLSGVRVFGISVDFAPQSFLVVGRVRPLWSRGAIGACGAAVASIDEAGDPDRDPDDDRPGSWRRAAGLNWEGVEEGSSC
jgi:hypothetical protein